MLIHLLIVAVLLFGIGAVMPVNATGLFMWLAGAFFLGRAVERANLLRAIREGAHHRF